MHIDSSTGLRIHTATGELTAADFRAALEAVYESPDFEPGKHGLWDLRAAKGAISSEEIDQLASFVGSRWGHLGARKIALVVSRDLDFGLARMYEQLLEIQSSIAVMVFRDIEEAKGWLLEADEPV